MTLIPKLAFKLLTLSPLCFSPQDAAADQSERRKPCLSPSQSGLSPVAAPPCDRSPPSLSVLMMSLTAVNGVSMETATTIWPTLEAAFPSLCFSDTCPPSPPKEATGQRRGEGHREEARLLRTGRREKKRHSQQNTKQNCQSSCSGLCVLWPDYNLCCFCAQQLLLFFWGSREHKKGSV